MVEELFGSEKVMTKKGDLVTPQEAFANAKIIAIYFSKHDCPPCRHFTPVFAEIYKELIEGGNTDLEVIFFSGDKTEEQFLEYYAEQPWIALPFKDTRLHTLA